MPTVPQSQRQVFDAPLPGVRVQAAPTAATLGGQLGDTAARLGAEWYHHEVQAANQTAVFEADRQLADKQTELEVQLSQIKGKNVLGADATILKGYDDHAAKVEAGLSNDQQRQVFAQRQSVRRQQLNATTQHYVQKEYGTFQDQETTGTIESARDRIRRNPEYPEIVKTEQQRAYSALGAFAARKGLIGDLTPEMVNDPQFQAAYVARGETPPTQEDLTDPTKPHQYASAEYHHQRAKLESSLHREVVNGFLAKDQDQSAKAYFDKNRLSFTAGDLDALEKNVLEGSTRGESRRQEQQLIQQFGIDTTEQRKAALGAVDKMTNDKVADATRTRLEHAFTSYDQLKAEQYTANFMGASKTLDEQWQQHPRKQARDFVDVPTWNAMKPSDQQALEVKLDRLRSPVTSHDPKAWFAFQSMTDAQLAAVKPNDLMRTYLNQFDPSHYDRALNEWNAARNNAEKGDKDPKFVSALSNRERIKNAWTESNIVDNSVARSKWTAQDEVNYSRFETAADKALSSLPKDAKPEEIDKVLHGLSDSLLKQKYTVDPGMFSRNKDVPAIGIPDVLDKSRSIRIPMKEIPALEQDTIKGLLRTGGKSFTTDKIERIYALRKMQQGGQMDAAAAKAAMKAIILE